MLAFLQYLIALVISAPDRVAAGRPEPPPQWNEIALVILAFGLVAAISGRFLRRSSSPESEAHQRRFDTVLDLGRVAVLVTFWFVAQRLDGRAVASALGVDDWVLVPHLLRLAPFGLLLGALRAGLHPAENHLRGVPAPLSRTLGFEARGALLPLGPILPLLVVWDLVSAAAPGSLVGAVRDVVYSLPVLQAFTSLALLFGALMVLPFLLCAVWRAKPLPEGPLRVRLEAYAVRVGLRSRGFRVWPTGGTVHNAAVIGPLPRFRYVVLTDALIDDLGEDEVEAVIAHEAGHARRGHILLFFGFTAVLVLSNLLPQTLPRGAAAALAQLDPLLRTVLTVLLWFGVVFGWVSRRFEQEADVYGIDTLIVRPGPDGRPPPTEHPFARALERIADATGGIREVTGWRHFSIADRVAFVHAYVADPAVRARYRRSIRILRGTLFLVIGAFVLFAGARLPAEIAAAPRIFDAARDPGSQVIRPLQAAQEFLPPQLRARSLVQAAALSSRAGNDERALRWLREAAALSPGDPAVLISYADALERAARPRGAAVVWSDLLALEGLPGTLRRRASEALGRLSARTD